jgi:subtilisin family serine protease
VHPNQQATNTPEEEKSESPRRKRGADSNGSSLWFVLFLFCTNALVASAQEFVPGQILVKPKTGVSDAALTERLKSRGAFHRQRLRYADVHVVNVSEEKIETLLASLRADPDIEVAERDGVARAAFVPNDPEVFSGDEWHLAKIQALQSWDMTIGTTNTVVAVLDSGVNSAHPDLVGRILAGYDFVFNDDDTSDDFGHGTAVAGTLIAAGNNNLGVAGVAYGCMVLPVKVVDSSGFAAYSAVANGIRYAVEQGARVINLSIAGDSPSTVLQSAIDYAWSNNVVVVAAVGNNAGTTPQYPAACEHVLAVCATAADDSLCSFSSYGPDVAIAAPGENIWTTQRDLSNPYGPWRGTSFASPIVAGAAALIASANPSLANTQIVSILQSTTDDLGAVGYDSSFGAGRVNAFRAVNAAATMPGSLVTPLPALASLTSNSVSADPTNVPPWTGPAFVSVEIEGLGRVTPNLNGKELQLGQSYTLRAVAGRGQVFAGWDGAPPGQSAFSSFSFVARSSLHLKARFVPSPFSTAAGNYYGLAVNTNNIAPFSSGYFTISLRQSGLFTGALAIGGKRLGLHGQFNASGDALVSVRRGTDTTLMTTVHVCPTNENDHLVGSITDGTWASRIEAARNVFNAVSNPAQQAGLRAFLLQQTAPQQIEAAHATTAITPGGATSVHGRLADGRAFSTSSFLAKNGDYPFFLSFHHGDEVLLGWLNFPAGPVSAGTVLWLNSGTDTVATSLQAQSLARAR